jgi:hypothetical protein
MAKYGFTTKEAKERAEELANELDKLLTERISALSAGSGKDPSWTQGRHAYIYYRSLFYELINIIGLK